jgi:hypothetical protein
MQEFLKKIKNRKNFICCPRCNKFITHLNNFSSVCKCHFATYYTETIVPGRWNIKQYGYEFETSKLRINCSIDAKQTFIYNKLDNKIIGYLPILLDPKSTEDDINKLLILL